jgi:Fic family protein
MIAEEFSDAAPGRLVPTIRGAVAFVPDPIPEHVALPAATVRLLAGAENALGRLAGTTAREFNPYLVGSPLLHREAILSSRIEGTITTPEKLVLLEAETSDGRRGVSAEAHDTQEVLNYVRAMQAGLRMLEELPMCLRLIRGVHEVLMRGVRGGRERPGEFRRDQNWIGSRIDDDILNARYVPPPVPEMERALRDLESYLGREQTDDRDPLLVQLALVHYQFEAIHPFRDSNGRIGRLLIPLLLCSCDRLDAPLFYVSAYFERNRDLYMDHLLEVSRTGEWIPWIDFFLRGVRESAQEADHHALGLLELRQRYHRLFQKSRTSALLIRLVDRLFQTPSITINQAAGLLEVSHQAATNNIRRLESEGIVREITGRRRNQVFVADEILRFMGDAPSESR